MLRSSFAVRRTLLSTTTTRKAPSVAIVGSGPSGFYVAKYLLRSWPESRVTMIDQWPTPFGLVRYGVAPDHPEVKVVENDFTSVAETPNFRFVGNVTVGTDVSVEALRSAYDAVVLACGAPAARTLKIPGEDLPGVLSARRFVAWYNSDPAHAALPDDFFGDSSTLRAVVVGNGNVALDCARILATKPEHLATTDIKRQALDALSGFSRRVVDVVGRRGLGQAAFTIKELRELTKIDGALFKAHDIHEEPPANEARAAKRKRDLVMEYLVPHADEEIEDKSVVNLRFLLKPVEFLEKEGRLGGVRFEKCDMEADQARGTGTFVDVECDVCLPAVGYLAQPPTLKHGEIVPHLDHTHGRVDTGLYCAGWVKRGPSGIIGSNIADARDTVQTLLDDLSAAESAAPPPEKKLLRFPDKATSWDDWRTIDAAERHAGSLVGAPRLKLTDLDAMRAVLSQEKTALS